MLNIRKNWPFSLSYYWGNHLWSLIQITCSSPSQAPLRESSDFVCCYCWQDTAHWCVTCAAALCAPLSLVFGLMFCCCWPEILNNFSCNLCFESEVQQDNGAYCEQRRYTQFVCPWILATPFAYIIHNALWNQNSGGAMMGGSSARLKAHLWTR